MKFEYLVVLFDDLFCVSSFNGNMPVSLKVGDDLSVGLFNKLGAEGWQMAAVIHNGLTFIFMRQILP